MMEQEILKQSGSYRLGLLKLQPREKLGPFLHRRHSRSFVVLEGEAQVTLEGLSLKRSRGEVFHAPKQTRITIEALSEVLLLDTSLAEPNRDWFLEEDIHAEEN